MPSLNRREKESIRKLRGLAKKVDLSGRRPQILYLYLRRALVLSNKLTGRHGDEASAALEVARRSKIDPRRSLAATLIAATIPEAGSKRAGKWGAAVRYGIARPLAPERFELHLHRYGADALAKKCGPYTAKLARRSTTDEIGDGSL